MVTRSNKPGHANDPSMLQLLLDYLTNTPVSHLLIHMVYICMICIFLSISYIVAFHSSALIQLYEDANNHKQFSNTLKLSAASDAKITSAIQKIMDESGGMRAYVYRYHNGLPAISGVPFFFQTNTHEVIAPGASRLISYEQRIPASIHVGMNNAFVVNKCLLIPNTQLDQNNQDYYFYESRNAISVLRCPIYMDNGDLFGFVGIDWNHTVSDNPDLTKKLQATAKEISNIFANK
jgi:hypothetical protein